MSDDTRTALPAPLHRGRYVARYARSTDDLQAAQRLRHLCFVKAAGRAPLAGGVEADAFDSRCDHVLIEDGEGRLICCFRLLSFASGAGISDSYSAQFYDVHRLTRYVDPMVELGRFCVHPDAKDPDVLRIAWGMMARVVDARGAGMLFGCSSFAGMDPQPYAQAFDLLAARYLAPPRWSASAKAPQVVRFARSAQPVTDHRAALAQVPPLLKTYLSMGGWVSGHAVVDRDMNTLHVFTGLEIAAIPAPRAKALRAV